VLFSFLGQGLDLLVSEIDTGAEVQVPQEGHVGQEVRGKLPESQDPGADQSHHLRPRQGSLALLTGALNMKIQAKIGKNLHLPWLTCQLKSKAVLEVRVLRLRKQRRFK